MNSKRRVWLAAFAVPMMLAACASEPSAADDRIVDVATGRALEVADVLRRLRAADVVLLGELHDNPHHHARRAALLAAIGVPVVVVAEHLPRAAAFVRLPADAAGDTLRRALEGAGFEARAWRWPLHEPLFTAVARAGHTLQGGNLDRDAARRLAREGAGALPAPLRPLVDAAPLAADARAALEADLLRGHCGHLPRERSEGLVAAQRGRDAAMAAAMLAAMPSGASGTGAPVVLLAGNNHVRRDYGVPQLLSRHGAPLRVLSIAFVEPGGGASGSPPYDIVWTTPAATREDPCKAFTAPRSSGG